MDMSSACSPPRQPRISSVDRAHPKFPQYQQYLSSMNRLMVEASSFQDWLACTEREIKRDGWVKHPRYREFLTWMQQTGAGGRKCPGLPSNAFPENFQYWLAGNLW